MLISAFAVVFCSFLLQICNSLIIKGEFSSLSTFVFITKFCLQRNGRLIFKLSYPRSLCKSDSNVYIAGCPKLVFYNDEPEQWNAVYKSDKTCPEKLSRQRLEPAQIYNLDPEINNKETHSLYAYNNTHRHCSWSEDQIVCEGTIFFGSVRERFWYFTLVNCETVSGLKLTAYYFEFLNGNGFDKHISANELSIFEMNLVGLSIFFIFSVIAIFYTVKLSSMDQLHVTFKLLMLALLLRLVSYVVILTFYLNYLSGFQYIYLKYFGIIVESISDFFLIILILLLSSGYSITRGRLSLRSTIKFSLFSFVYIISLFFTYIHYLYFFDPGTVLYFYDSVPGYIHLVLYFIACCLFCYAIFFTTKNYPEKLLFYSVFFIICFTWILLKPILALLANFLMEDWYREKVMFGTSMVISIITYSFMLILTFPSKFNECFPYHVPVNQISDIMKCDNDNFPHQEEAPERFGDDRDFYAFCVTEKTFKDLQDS